MGPEKLYICNQAMINSIHMPKGLGWTFPIIILGKDESPDFPLFQIDEIELNIIWLLGKKGCKSIYELKKTGYELPKHLPGDVWCDSSQTWKRRLASKKELTYFYPFIHKAVKRLERRGLVTTVKDGSGDRTKRIVKLTFQGLILYLRNSDDKQKFTHAIEHYRSFIPFAELWEALTKQLGEAKTIEALELTLKNFQVRNVKFRIKRPQMEFNGFLEGVKVIFAEKGEFVFVRDVNVDDYLSHNAETLRNSYIAYLALNDIKELSSTEKKELNTALDNLKSERELAHFEDRQISSSNSLFRSGRVEEFLPKYSGIEYFFTGMFVNNLLWNKREDEWHKEYTDEFDVEYL